MGRGSGAEKADGPEQETGCLRVRIGEEGEGAHRNRDQFSNVVAEWTVVAVGMGKSR